MLYFPCRLDGEVRATVCQYCWWYSRGLDGGASEQSVKQLFEIVKSLCAAVKTLTNDTKQLMQNVCQ